MKQVKYMFMAVLAVVFLFTSCQKEGKYNPNKKITEIWRSSTYTYSNWDSWNNTWETETGSTPKYRSEQWIWSGNKLTSINHYNSDGDVNSIETFTYDGNRVSSISFSGEGSDTYNFTYKNGKLTTIENIYYNKLYSTTTYKHDGQNISSAQITFYEFEKKGKAEIFPTSVCRFVFPCDANEMAKTMATLAAASTTKAQETYTFNYEWDGKNVKRIILSGPGENYIEEYSYDKKKNPFKGFHSSWLDETPYEVLSANNTIRLISDGDVREYTYTYDGNWPITRSYTDSYSRDSYTYTTYYEYK